MFQRAASLAGKRGMVRFQADFTARNGRRRRAAFQIHPLKHGSEQGAMVVSFRSSRLEPEPVPRDGTLAMVQRVARLLDRAVLCGRACQESEEEREAYLAVLVALVDHARGLLGSLEPTAHPEEPIPMSDPRTPA